MADISLDDVRKLLVDNCMLRVQPEEIGPDMLLFGPDSLGLDSIDALQLTVGIEKSYGIVIKDPAVAREAFHSVKNLAAVVEQPAACVNPPDRPPPHSAGLYRATMFDVGAWLGRWLPLSLNRALAMTVGWIYALTHPQKVAVVERNLHLLDASLGSRAARKTYGEFGKTLADYFYIGTRPPEEAVKIIGKIDGVEHLHAAKAMGKGALVVTAHFGLFELGGLLLAQHGFSAAVLTYPEPSAALTHWRAAFRRRLGVDTLEIGADSFAFLTIAERLRRGQFVASLIDRPHPTDRTPVALPNGTAYFSAGIFLLAAHGGVPVIPATMVRRDDGSYHAQVFPPMLITARESRAETLRFYSQQIADTFLPVLRAHPEQWYQFVPLSS